MEVSESFVHIRRSVRKIQSGKSSKRSPSRFWLFSRARPTMVPRSIGIPLCERSWKHSTPRVAKHRQRRLKRERPRRVSSSGHVLITTSSSHDETMCLTKCALSWTDCHSRSFKGVATLDRNAYLEVGEPLLQGIWVPK